MNLNNYCTELVEALIIFFSSVTVERSFVQSQVEGVIASGCEIKFVLKKCKIAVLSFRPSSLQSL